MGGSFARTGVPQTVSTTSYDAANRQTVFADKSMTFDNNGNLQTITDNAGTTTYTWNTRNQLTGIGGSVSASFSYDGLGRRKTKTINGVTTNFLYDGLNPVQETGAATANLMTGLGIDEFVTRTESGVTSTFLSDALGSAVALTSSSGTVQTQYTYEPFGKVNTTEAANNSPYQYTSRESDSTELNYYRARYHSPGLHRFVSEDPIGFGAGDANLFSYTQNSPINFTDPTGHIIVAPVVVGAALCVTGAAVGGYAYNQLAGRKTLLGYLGSASAGCVGGILGGGAIGIGVEAAAPWVMTAGVEAQLWVGVTANLAMAEAALYGRALVNHTFTGNAIAMAQNFGLVSRERGYAWMQALSANFVSAARSASVLVGPELNAGKTFFTHEWPALISNGASVSMKYVH